MQTQELLKYYEAGWIPAPNETQGAFCARINAFETLKEAFRAGDVEGCPFQLEDALPHSARKEAEDAARLFYGTVLKNSLIFCSSKKLAPWQGAMNWIFEVEPQNALSSVIQLHRRFATKKTLFGIYERKELLVHELAHAGRMAFHEPKFEEIIAYASAKSSFHRYFGPLFSSTREALVGMMLLGGALTAQMGSFFLNQSGQEQAGSYLFWLANALLCILVLGLGISFLRLWVRQRVFKRAHSHLVKALETRMQRHEPLQELEASEVSSDSAFDHKAWSILYCLSDEQISHLANDSHFFDSLAHSKADEPSLHEQLIACLIER